MELNKVYGTNAVDGMRSMISSGLMVDMIFTDPPYGIDYQSNWGWSGEKLKKIKNDDNLDWFQEFSDLSFQILKPNSAMYCFTRFDVYPFMYNCMVASGFNVKNLLTIQKGQKGGNGDLEAQYANDCELIIYANKGRRKFNKTKLAKTDGRKGSPEYRTRLPNVWFDTPYNVYPKANLNVFHQLGKTIHPTEKNVEMIKWFLQISSNEGDVVLDQFIGSGSTAVACVETGRQYIGFEIEKDYLSLCGNRELIIK